MTTRKSKKATVSVWVPWGNDQIECKMPLRTWRRIVAGEDEVCGFKTAFEEFQGWGI
jgi:hypothetical protein